MVIHMLTGDWQSPNSSQDTSTQYGSASSAISNANWPHCVLQKTSLAGCTGNVGMVSWQILISGMYTHTRRQAGGPGFKSCSLPLDGFVFGGPKFNSSTLCKSPAGQPPTSWDSVLFVIFVSSFQWHACELAELSACRAKCMTTINMIYIYITRTLHLVENRF